MEGGGGKDECQQKLPRNTAQVRPHDPLRRYSAETQREGGESGIRRESSDRFVRLFPGVEVGRFGCVSERTRRERWVDQEDEIEREGYAGIAGCAAAPLAVHHCSTATDGGRRGAQPWPAQER